jgi:hypothetical protein
MGRTPRPAALAFGFDFVVESESTEKKKINKRNRGADMQKRAPSRPLRFTKDNPVTITFVPLRSLRGNFVCFALGTDHYGAD